MVAIVAGNGLGLFNTSLNTLGGIGTVGQGTLGQAGGQAQVNASTGNLILQFTDEQLSGLGRDLLHQRTYNTLGALNDTDGDGWRWDGERRVVLSGTRNTAGSTLTRTNGDGHESVYTWTGTRYQSTDGDGAHDTLQWVSASSEWLWTDGSRRTTERYSGSTGRLLMTTDANGTSINYSYDAAGRLSSVKDSSGQELVLVYNASGKLERLDTRTSEGGALTRQVYYSYDTAGRLTQVRTDLTPADNSITDGQVYTTTYTYDGSSFRIASVTQSDGTSVSFTYQLVGSDYRIRTVTDASGTTTFTYNIASRRTDVSNGLGQVWSYFYDTQGQLTQLQTPAVNGQRLSTHYAYDSQGNVTQITDGLGQTLTYAYDANGNRTLERDALGNTLARIYNANNQLVNEIRYTVPATWNAATGSWTEPPASAAQVTRYAYDSQSRLRYQISAAGNVTEYRYDANGLLSQEIVYDGALFSVASLAPTTTRSESQLNTWAAARNLSKIQLTELVYDYRGNLSRRTVYSTVDSTGAGVLDAAAQVTEYIYSEHGQLLQGIAVRGANRTSKTTLSSVVYDGMGRVLSEVDASGTRTYLYNGAARSVAQTNSAGMTVTQVYDTLGRLIGLTEMAAGETSRSTQYVYDAAGRLTMVQDPTGVRSYTFYDEAGRVSARVDGTGAVIEYGYDAAGQLILEKRYATLANTSAWYNGTVVSRTLVSQIRPSAHANDRSTHYAYDSAGRLSSTTDAAGVVTAYSYDGRGQLIQQQTGDRITRSLYDAAGRQIGQLDAEGYLREYTYNAAGHLIRVLRYGNTTDETIRAEGSLAQLRPTSGSNLLTWYFYDNAGRQIGSVDEQRFVTETVYDEAGNTQQTIRYANVYAPTISSSTAFATVKTAVASGAKQTNTFTYDGQGRLSQRTATDGTITTYEYDNAGRLIRETQAAGTTEARSQLTRYDAFGQVIGKLLGEAATRITAGMTPAQVQAIYAQYGLTYSYDAAGRVASVTDAAGNRTASYYDAAGRLTHVINALGEVSETQYTSFGDVSARSQLNNRLSTANTASLSGGLLTTPVQNLVQAIRNASQDNRSTYAYDKRGLLTTSTDALGFVTSYGYNDFGDQTSITRTVASGQTVTQALNYNRRGELIGSIEDVGGLARNTATVYDAFGRVISQTDGRGLVHTTSYTGNGRIITVKNPLNQGQVSEYDAFGRLLKQTDALGKITTYAYNDNTRTLVVTTPDGVAVTTVKDRHGQTLTVTDGAGAVTRYSYNKDGQLLTSRDGLNRTTTNSYDAAGRLFSVTDALGRATSYGYDAANRVITRTDAAGNVTRYTFDGQGRQVRVTEAEGLAEQRITDYAYDRSGQLLSVTQDPNGLKLSTRYSYDGLGRQVQVARGTTASPNQQVTLYTFDALGRRISERQDPNGLNLTTQYVYNANDQVTRKIDGNGNSTWYRYDNAGRLIDTVDALGGVTRHTYNANGQVTAVRAYVNRLSAAVIAGLGDAPASISPSSNSTRDQITYYVRDDLGQVRYTINALNQVTETVYDNAGRVVESRQYDTAIAAGTARTIVATAAALSSAGAQPRTTTYVYDAAGQLTRTTDAAGKNESYTYDTVGNRKTLTNKNGHIWRYNYDSLNRLVEEITPSISVASITDAGVVSAATRFLVTRIDYDALGNVISRSEGRQRTAAGNAASADDLSQARTTTYAYDSVGRQTLITSPGWYNKLTGQYQQVADVTTPANTFQVSTEVTYDALGNAVRNRVRVNNTGTVATDFVDSFKIYDAIGRVTHDIDALKGVTAYSHDGAGNVLTTVRYSNALTKALPSRGYYLKADITASTIVANAALDRTLTNSYDAVGRLISVQQNTVGIYRFTGNVAGSSLVNLAPTTLYVYDAFGQLIRETQVGRNANGATAQTGAATHYYYDQSGNRIGMVDALGNHTRLEYDALGQLSRQTEYATRLTSWNTTLPAVPASHNDDRITRFSYDALGRLSQVTLENVRYWQQQVNASTGVVTTAQMNGALVVSSHTYDNIGNLTSFTDAHGNVTHTTYNALGHVTKLTEPERAAARNVTNPFASVEVIASPTITYSVNAFGQVIREVRAAGKDAANLAQAGATQTTRTRYDAAGHEIQEIQANNSAIDYKVDVAGQRIEERQQVSATLTAWTANGVTVSYNQTLRRTYEYDRLGQQTATIDWYTAANGSQQSTRQSVVYNRFGEVAQSLLNGNLLASYSYDQAGRVAQQHDAQGITVFAYDLSGAASRITQQGDTSTTADDRITYQRNDLLGNVLEQHLPAFEANINADTLNNVNLTLTTPIIRQTYDRWGNVLTHVDARGYQTAYSYDHNNQILSEVLPETDILRENGTSYRGSLIHEKRYDALGQMIRDVDKIGSTELRSRQNVYNAAGQLIREIDALGFSRHYRYDAHGNRIATQDAVGTVLVDGYDVMDRHINHGVIRNGAKVTLLTKQYDQAGRLYGEINGTSAIRETLTSTANADWTSTTSGVAGNTRYTLFDERGNITKTRNESNIERSYEYDTASRKVRETDGLNNTLTWTFDNASFGRLKSRTDLGGRDFSYNYNDFGQVVSELAAGVYTSSGTIYAPVVVYTKPDKFYSYYNNGFLKSVSEGLYEYDPFGVLVTESSKTSSYSYDLSGSRVREVDSARQYLLSEYAHYAPGNSNPYLAFGMDNQYSSESRFSFDEKNRLKEAVAPSGNYVFGAPGKSLTHIPEFLSRFAHFPWDTPTSISARMESLKYSYDEFGNRRRVYMDTVNQSNTRKVIDDWYKYDLADRVIVDGGFVSAVGNVVAGKLGNTVKGSTISYDAAGRRQFSEKWTGQGTAYVFGFDIMEYGAYNGDIYRRDSYVYDDMGRVLSIYEGVAVRGVGTDSSAAVIASGSTINFDPYLEYTYDTWGRRLSKTERSVSSYTFYERTKQTAYSYRGDGELVRQLDYDSRYINDPLRLSQATFFDEGEMRDAAGNQVAYRYVIYKPGSTAISYRGNYSKTYAAFDSYKEGTITATWTKGGSPGNTTFTYSERGELISAVGTGGTAFTRHYASNAEGQIIARREKNGATQSYLYHQGAALANYGNISAPEVTDTFVPISTDYPGLAPGNYVVNQDDTLAGIAQTVWGDAKMWYLIADANGLASNADLVAGATLKIPNVVGSQHNNATTFKPYNPSEVIGETTPSPLPPKPKKKKCNALASVVMVVVAVVATVFTAGAAAVAMGAVGSTGVMAAGATALAGGSWGLAGAAVLGGAVGSAAAQLAGKAMGVVDDFSWRQVAAGGLTAGATAGLGTLASTAKIGSWARTAAETIQTKSTLGYSSLGVFNYANSQVANRIVGLNTSFSWSALASSVAGQNIASGVGNHLPIKEGLPGAFIKGQVSAHAAAAINDKWFGGNRPSYGQIAVDAFGNTLGNYAVDQMANASAEVPLVQADHATRISSASLSAMDDALLSMGNILAGWDPRLEASLAGPYAGQAFPEVLLTSAGRVPGRADTVVSQPPQGKVNELQVDPAHVERRLAERVQRQASSAVDMDRMMYGDRVNDPILMGVNSVSEETRHLLSTAKAGIQDYAVGLGGTSHAAGAALYILAEFMPQSALDVGLSAAGLPLLGRGASVARAGVPNSAQVANLRRLDVNDVNAEFISRGQYAPYDIRVNVREFEAASDLSFVRVHNAENPRGAWMVRPDEIAGMTPAQIQRYLALPEMPTHVQNITVPAGHTLRTGRVGPQPQWGVPNPRATQYQSPFFLPDSAFGPSRELAR